MLWVISNMIVGNNVDVIDYFVQRINLLNIIMSKFLNHEDILVQREASYVLYYIMQVNPDRNIGVLDNEHSLHIIATALSSYHRNLPETIEALLSLIDLVCEEINGTNKILYDFDVVNIIETIIEKFGYNRKISQLGDHILRTYFYSSESTEIAEDHYQNSDRMDF